MVQQFGIQDVALTNGIFRVADAESKGALSVRELLGNLSLEVCVSGLVVDRVSCLQIPPLSGVDEWNVHGIRHFAIVIVLWLGSHVKKSVASLLIQTLNV